MMQDFPFDATITLLVFLIGVPALVLQSMPSEVRRAVMKRSLNLQIETFLYITGGLLTVFGSILISVCLVPAAYAPVVWAIMLLIVFALVVFASLRAVQFYGRRDAIVSTLQRQVLRRLRRGQLVEDTLEELIDLGIQSAPGQDKEVVLRSLLTITEQLCLQRLYHGDRLETLIQGLVAMLTSGPQPWSPQNFTIAAYILQRIVITFNIADASNDSFRDVDLMHAVHALSKLGQAALTMENESVSMSFMQALVSTGNRHRQITTIVSQALYEVGIAALAKQELLVATAALDKLGTLIEIRAPAENELVADTLGLLGHFWVSGDTAQGYAARKLMELNGNLKDELPTALKSAQEHYRQRMRFQTADNLNELTHELSLLPYRLVWTSLYNFPTD
jgi:hypothetical protein